MMSSCSLDSCRNPSTAALSDASEATSFDDPSFASVTGTDARCALPPCQRMFFALEGGAEIPACRPLLMVTRWRLYVHK